MAAAYERYLRQKKRALPESRERESTPVIKSSYRAKVDRAQSRRPGSLLD